MKLRMLKHPVIRGRKYLLQLVITCVTLILFPLILSLIFICNRSYSQLIATYQQHYEETAEQFSNQFSKGVSDIYLNSLLISSESRKKENDAAQLDIASLQQDGFYIYSATKVITEYGKSTSEIFGIYYYDIDLLITKNYSYSANSFARNCLKISQDNEDQTELDHFLSLESENIVFFAPSNRNMIYIGIRTRIGPSRSDALMVYVFDDTTIDTSLLQGGNYDAAQYLIFSDSQRVLLEFGESYCETDLLLDTVSQHWSSDGFSFIDNIDSTTFIVSAHRDASTAFTYLIALPLNRAADGLQNFYSMLIRILLVIVFVLLIAIGLLIYINYRPISALMRKLNKNQKNVGEFEAISDEINRMTDEISEKNMVILDSLLGNILYGIPLSEDMIKRINIPEDANCFFVFTLSGDIDTTQRTEITAQLLQRFSTKVLITDILFQELTVLICMAQTDCQQEIFDFITDYLQIPLDAESTLHRGETVFSINEIKHSFESNFPPAPADEAGSAPEPVTKTVFQDPTSQLMYQIVEYLDGRFTDPLLSQSSVADHFQISTYSLSRLFKSKAGINFTEYVTNKRIQLAQELLRKKDSSIPAIAEQVGIPNVNYFYKVFKTVTGTSPAKYQNHIEN